jgi:hypothetical protein
MGKNKSNVRRILAVAGVVMAAVLLGYLWVGFWFPDPYFLAERGVACRFLYQILPLTLLPLGFLLMALLLLLRDRALRKNLLLLLFSLVLLGLLLYPLADLLWYVRGKQKSRTMVAMYHPYLQLKPRLPDVADLPRSGKGILIFCLGGSTTEMKDSRGRGWPERVEAELRSRSCNDSIFVYNLGRQWYTTQHTLFNYEVNLRKYRPDLLIVMHNINDFLQNADFSYFSRGTFREDYGHFYGPSAQLPDQYGLFGHFRESLARCWYHRPREVIRQDTFPGVVPFTRNLKTLIQLARLDSTQVILLSQPNLFSEKMGEEAKRVCSMVNKEAVGPGQQWDFETAIRGMRLYNDLVKEVAREEGALFIDLEREIPKTLTWFFDEVHYNDTTFNVIGTTLGREIARSGLLHTQHDSIE